MAPEHSAALPICAICGDPITDRQNIDYAVDRAGNVISVTHERMYHIEQMATAMQAAHDAGEHVGLERGICAACDFAS